MSALEIYVVNVGQADTSVIRTPAGNIIVIDAYRPDKLADLLGQLVPAGGRIAHLILTHPHSDHYGGAGKLLASYQVERVTLAPFWFEPGTAGYHAIINSIQAKGIAVRFLSGYERTYPDGGTYPDFAGAPYLELVGPPNDILEELSEQKALTPNHLSIITRLTYGKFSMVFAADAQMENWAHYDREGMLQPCDVLKAAHHGSRRGSQWERVERLGPRLVVVSSDPEDRHHLPDLLGGALFMEYGKDAGRTAALTVDSGTIRITVDGPKKAFKVACYGEGPDQKVAVASAQPLIPTDWGQLVRSRLG
jgi:competence protein ComEC